MVTVFFQLQCGIAGTRFGNKYKSYPAEVGFVLDGIDLTTCTLAVTLAIFVRGKIKWGKTPCVDYLHKW